MTMKKTAIALALSTIALPALALNELPQEKGFSGFVNLGASGGSVESNFLAKISGINVDLSDDTIYNLGQPDDKDIVVPAVAFEFGYLFGNKKTRIALGNDLSDFLQFDRATRLSLRHDFDRIGRLQVAFLNSTGMPTEVYEDPYQTGSSRGTSDFTSTGGRITWDKILNSQFEFKASFKENDVDKERSGEDQKLGLNSAQRQLLERDGDVTRVELGYMFSINNNEHLIRPSVSYIDRDLDGDAMSQDGYEVAISWNWNGDDFRWVNNAFYQSLDGDAVNPIFNDVNDADRYGISSQLFFPGLFGLEKWTPNLTFAWAEADSDIDFNDTSLWIIGAAMFREF